MKNLQNIKNVYFLGIGGIGMSALARYFKFTGRNVAGYDKTPSSITDALQKEGIAVHFEDDIRNIPKNWNPSETLAVFTPAIPHDHAELSWFREKPMGLLKRAKVLGMICNEKQGIAIAGTHGKTTVSTMTAHILNKTEAGCGAFLGGISKNFESNLLLPKKDSPWIVAEADEFDRSFLHLNPYLALVTSIDADHLDIYGDKEKIEEAFRKFVSQIQSGGKLVLKRDVKITLPEPSKIQVFSYSLHEEADFCARNLRYDQTEACFRFDLKTPDGIMANFTMKYPGLVNVENAIGAAALAFLAGVSAADIRDGIADYEGVIRRFDVRLKNNQGVYIDDYAHHPEELKAFISSVRALYPGKKITGIFQPHLYSRTRDFADEFASSLDLLDEAVLLPLYPAREEPLKNISSDTIFQKMKLENKLLMSKEETLEWLGTHNTEIVLTMGAGDIDRMREPIKQLLISRTDV